MIELDIAERQYARKLSVPSHGVNPAGGAKAAELVDYGVGSALEFVNNSERHGATGFILATDTNMDKEVLIRTGWTSDAISGNVRLGIKYKWIKEGETVLGEDGDTTNTRTVLPDADFPKVTDIPIGHISAGAIGLAVSFIRYGDDSLDTCSGSVFLIGTSLIYNL